MILKCILQLTFRSMQNRCKIDLLTICNLSSTVTPCRVLASTSSSDVIFSISSVRDLEDVPSEEQLELSVKTQEILTHGRFLWPPSRHRGEPRQRRKYVAPETSFEFQKTRRFKISRDAFFLRKARNLEIFRDIADIIPRFS